MFQFDGLPPRTVWIRVRVAGHGPRRVPPFGHLGISGRVRLPGDYRGLPRPSSASCAKASAARPHYLRFPLGWFPKKRLVIVNRPVVMGAYRFALRSQMRSLAPPPRGEGRLASYLCFENRVNDLRAVIRSMGR